MNFLKTIATGAVLATGLSVAAFTPAPAQAQSIVDVARVIVGINDIVYRGGVPYYRHGSYRPQDRIIVVRDGGRNRYYRNVPRGNAYGYYGHPSKTKVVKVKHRDGRYYRDDDRRGHDRDRWDRDDRDDRRGRGR